VATLKGHTGGVMAVAFSPDRSLLASIGRDGRARIWNVGGAPGDRSPIREGDSRFRSLAFASSGRTLAAGFAGPDGHVRVFDVTEKAPFENAKLRGPHGSVDAVAFTPDGKLVAGGGEDHILRIWEPAQSKQGETRAELRGHSAPIRALAFAPDGQGLASASADGTVRLWAVSRIRSWERGSLPHPGEVRCLAFSTDGRSLATAGHDGVVRVWDPAVPKQTPRIEIRVNAGEIRTLAFTLDNSTVITVGDGGRVLKWNPYTGQRLQEWECPGAASGFAITPDGRYLAAGKAEGTIGIYRIAEKRT
jgi:WD40 repeat protein